MSVCVIYHSETGNTRTVAERLAAATEGDLVEVKDLAGYSKLGMYLIKGGPRAMRGKKTDVEPAVNAAVAALRGIEGEDRSRLLHLTRGAGEDA